MSDTVARRSILLISFDFPPSQSSSGMLRIVAFARALLAAGWSVTVLTADRRDTTASKAENEHLIPPGCRVIRARAYDAAQKFAIAGKYPGMLELPDRFSSWIPTALVAGMRELRRNPVSHILSSYPIASAHVVGRMLAKFSGAKWIADFRDPMVLQGHPDTSARRRAHRWVERKTIEHCEIALFTNTAVRDAFRTGYPENTETAFEVIENGYDDVIFARAEHACQQQPPGAPRPEITVLHSGSIYPDHRDPRAFFSAVSTLQRRGMFSARPLQIMLRASGYDAHFRRMIAADYPEIAEIVQFGESVDYVASLSEVLASDALLLLQGASCNAQVPAKLYEYARSGRPILALTDAGGATAATLRKLGVREFADLADAQAIEKLLIAFMERLEADDWQGWVPDVDTATLARSNRGAELVSLLEAME